MRALDVVETVDVTRLRLPFAIPAVAPAQHNLRPCHLVSLLHLLHTQPCTASLNEQVAESLGAIDPRLGAIYNSSTDGINQLLREIATTQQDAVERYLRASNNRMVGSSWLVGCWTQDALMRLHIGVRYGGAASLTAASRVLTHTYAPPLAATTPSPPRPNHQPQTHSQTPTQNFADELDKTMTLGGQIITQMATNAATAIKSAQSEIDKVLPGPPLQAVLTDLRCVVWLFILKCVAVFVCT